jgi:hypothetical protein
MLAEQVDYVVGVETHRDQHAVAIVDAHTGAVIAQTTTAASARGYADAVRVIWTVRLRPTSSGATAAARRRHCLTDRGSPPSLLREGAADPGSTDGREGDDLLRVL